MSYKYNPYRDTFTHIDDETPITAYPVVATLTEDVIEKIANAVVRKLREEQHGSD